MSFATGTLRLHHPGTLLALLRPFLYKDADETDLPTPKSWPETKSPTIRQRVDNCNADRAVNQLACNRLCWIYGCNGELLIVNCAESINLGATNSERQMAFHHLADARNNHGTQHVVFGNCSDAAARDGICYSRCVGWFCVQYGGDRLRCRHFDDSNIGNC